MTFQVIKPYTITDSEIDSTNIATESAYSGSATYTLGDVVLGSDDQTYEFIGPDGSSGAHAAPTDTGQTDWVLLGPPNYLRSFDVQVGVDQQRVIATQAERADTITYTISGLGAIMGIAFMNVQAESISLTVTSSGGTSGDVYDATYSLRDLANVAGSFFRWLTLPINRERLYTLTDIYWPAGCTVEITIDRTGDTARVGAIVMGLAQELGVTLVDAQWSQSSRSFKSFDGFKTSIVRRYPGSRIDCDTYLDNRDAAAVRQVMQDLEGVAAVYIPAAERPEFTIYGVLDGNTPMTGRAAGRTFLSVRVEAI